ncbi:MAG: hypothetical protein K8953_13850, partial [Proteobacteria bacterium]|nr:hypothetical protein [Pseudomonadota bacterium]
QTTGKLNWHGQFHLTARISNTKGDVVKYTRDFVLTITFNSTGGTLEGLIPNLDDLKFNKNSPLTNDFYLENARFDTNGVITGETVFNASSIGGLNFGRIIKLPGTLTGLIGQEGAVAVFNNGNVPQIPSFRYAGGFVVQPNVLGAVTYADWVRANPAPLTKTISVNGNDRVVPLVESGIVDAARHLPGIFDVPLSGNHFLRTIDGELSRGSKDAGHVLIREILGENGAEVRRGTVSLDDDNRVKRKLTYVRFGDATNSEGDKIGDDEMGGFIYYTGFISTRLVPNLSFPDGEVKTPGTPYSYAGILDDTNLGAPLTQTTGTAQWKGQFSYQGFSGGFYNHDNPFTLNITYTATGGKINAFVPNIGLVDADLNIPMHLAGYDPTGKRNTDFYLEGTFDFRGVISGYTIQRGYSINTGYADAAAAASDLQTQLNKVDDLNTYTDRDDFGETLGVLAGLIGEKGAVGVWHTITPESSGGGGFVAAPSAPVMEHYKAWQASFDSAPATTITSAENRFLSDSDNIFDNLRTEPNGGATPAPITTLNMDANVNNSVSFANGYFNNAGNTIRSFHATIGVDADLGATLPVWQTGQTATAMWNGKFRAESG